MILSPLSVRVVAVALGVGAGLWAVGCAKSGSLTIPKTQADAASMRPVTIEHEPCDTKSASASQDNNGDGKADMVSVTSGGREVCRGLDLNFDGRFDRYVYFDANNEIRRVESDYDRDGRIDEVAIYVGGKLIRKDREMNLDGRVDTWDIFEDGKLVRRERDSDGDGKVDQWWTFPDPNNLSCPIVAVDKDGDGKPDPGSEVDMCKPPDDAPQNLLASSGAGPGPSSSGATSPPPPAPSASSATPPAPSGNAPSPSGSAPSGGSK